MSQSSSDTTEEVKPIPQPLCFVDDMWPCYLTSETVTQADIRALNLPMAYLLTNINVTEANKTTRRAALMKMMNGAFGYCTTEVPMSDLGISGVSTATAGMKLPKLPWALVTELDMFFRAVFEKQGTESIVMLTYDLDYLDTPQQAQGWDYFVPTQENTAADCTYNKDEILKELEDKPNVMLAGSVHSHPEMSAFFSKTDHDDQQDWEGLHITYAWPKHGLTEYHIEMVLGGKQWQYEPQGVFEIPPPPKLEGVDFTDVMKRVSKETPKSYATTGYAHGGQSWQSSVGNNGGTTGAPARSYSHSGPSAKQPVLHVPSDCPDPRKTVVVAVLDEAELNCRFCAAPITNVVRNTFRCYACASFLVREGMDLEDLIQARADLKLPAASFLKLDADVPIYFWSILPDPDSGTGAVKDLYHLVAGEELEEAKK